MDWLKLMGASLLLAGRLHAIKIEESLDEQNDLTDADEPTFAAEVSNN